MSKPPFRKTLFFVLLVGLILAVSSHGPHGIMAQTPVATETATASPVPQSQPLKLLWQADVMPDDLVVEPNGIAVDDQGNAYLDSASGDPVKKFDRNGKMVATFGSPGTNAGQFTFETGVAVDGEGNVYVADFAQSPRIEKFDSKGNFLTQWATEPPTGPAGIGIDSKGNVYVANHRKHDHYIQKFDSYGNLLAEWGTTGTDDGQFMARTQGGIQGLAVDKQDNIYVTDPLNHRIQKFDSNGKFLAKFGTEGANGGWQTANPFAVAVDAEGNIYVNDGSFLQKHDASGKFLAQWPLEYRGDLDSARWIAVDGQGDLFVIAHAEVTGLNGSKANIDVLKKFRQPAT